MRDTHRIVSGPSVRTTPAGTLVSRGKGRREPGPPEHETARWTWEARGPLRVRKGRTWGLGPVGTGDDSGTGGDTHGTDVTVGSGVPGP